MNEFLEIPEVESEDTPDLQDFLVVLPGQPGDTKTRVYRISTIIDQFAERINRDIPKGSVQVEDLSDDVKNFIIRAGAAIASSEEESEATTPVTPTERTDLPQAPAGIIPPADIVAPQPDVPPVKVIPKVSIRPRINPPSEVSAPVVYHPSQPQKLYLLEEAEKLTLSYEPPVDDGGAAVTFEVAIKKASSTTAITSLTWIDNSSNYSYVFTELEEGVEYIVYVRSKNSTGYSFAAEIRGIPVVTPDMALTLEVLRVDNYFHTAFGRSPSKVRFLLRYSKPVVSVVQNEITVVRGTITSITGSGNSHIVTVQPSGTGLIRIEVGVDAASTSVDEKIAAVVRGPWTFHVRPGDPDTPRSPEVIEGDKRVKVTWLAPTSFRNIDKYQISLDATTWIDVLKGESLAPEPNERFEHEFVGLTNDRRISIYLRSANVFGVSQYLLITAVPQIASNRVAVPESALPAEPRNTELTILKDNRIKVLWDAPVKDNFTGFEIKRDDADWVKLDRSIREYTFSDTTKWKLARISLRSINDRSYSDIIEFRDVIQGYPDRIASLTANAGNDIIQIQSAKLPSTPLDSRPYKGGYTQWYGYEVLDANDVVVAEGDMFGDIPTYAHPLTNGVEYTVRAWSKTENVKSEYVLEATVTPAETHAADNDPGSPTAFTLTPGTNQLEASWTAPSDGGGGDGVAYYRLDIEPVTGFAYFTPDGSGDTSITITGLQTGVEYTVSLVAVNNNGGFGQSVPDYDDDGNLQYDSRGVILVRPSTRNSAVVTATGTPS